MSGPNRLNPSAGRRRFLGHFAAAATLGACTKLLEAQAASPTATEPNVLGPRPGYSPQVGSFVSMLTWMREANGILTATKDLSQAELDFLFDANANTIGALMMPLAATETYYQMNTFDGMKWETWPDEVKKKWDGAIELGDRGWKTIQGHDRDYYVGILREVREKTLAEFRKRDDAWLLAINKAWP